MPDVILPEDILNRTASMSAFVARRKDPNAFCKFGAAVMYVMLKSPRRCEADPAGLYKDTFPDKLSPLALPTPGAIVTLVPPELFKEVTVALPSKTDIPARE